MAGSSIGRLKHSCFLVDIDLLFIIVDENCLIQEILEVVLCVHVVPDVLEQPKVNIAEDEVADSLVLQSIAGLRMDNLVDLANSLDVGRLRGHHIESPLGFLEIGELRRVLGTPGSIRINCQRIDLT